jgi:hypothetical protein
MNPRAKGATQSEPGNTNTDHTDLALNPQFSADCWRVGNAAQRFQAKSASSARTTCGSSYQNGSESRWWYQPRIPAKDLLAQFWKLEEEAEKMLEGLATT